MKTLTVSITLDAFEASEAQAAILARRKYDMLLINKSDGKPYRSTNFRLIDRRHDILLDHVTYTFEVDCHQVQYLVS